MDESARVGLRALKVRLEEGKFEEETEGRKKERERRDGAVGGKVT